MAKKLLILIIVGGLIAGGYFGYRHWQSTQQAAPDDSTETTKVNESLQWVPADTWFFAGALTDLTEGQIAKYQQILPPAEFQNKAVEHINNTLNEIGNGQEIPQGVQFLLALFQNAVNNPDFYSRMMSGYTGQGSAMYSVGLLPVFRHKLTDADAFWQFVEETAKENNVQATKHTLGSSWYYAYPLLEQADAQAASVPEEGIEEAEDINDADEMIEENLVDADSVSDETSSRGLSLLLGMHGDYLVATIDWGLGTEEALKVAFGAEKPTVSLASKAPELIQKAESLDFMDNLLVYINHISLSNGVLGTGNPQLTTMLDAILAKFGKNQVLQAVRAPECQTAISSAVAHAPYTWAGYRNIQKEGNTVHMTHASIIEISPARWVSHLSKLVGVTPGASSVQNLIDVELGLNVDEIPGFYHKAWSKLSQNESSCPFIVQMQQGLQKAPPMTLNMVMSPVNGIGIKGASFSLKDFTLSSSETKALDVTSLTAAVSLSADNPKQLWEMSGMPALPEAGEVFEFPVPAPHNEIVKTLYISHSAQNLFAATDKEALADITSQFAQPGADNMLMSFSVDYQKLINEKLKPHAESFYQKVSQEERDGLKDLFENPFFNGRQTMSFGTHPQGLELITEIEMTH